MIRIEKTHLPVAALTHPGMKGKNNEDRFGVTAFRSKGLPNTPILLAVLSDGIGGNRAGEVASELAVNQISQYVAQSDGRNPQVILENAIHSASGRIYQQAQAIPEQHGMGATCACAWIAGDRLFTATVGDSRIYLMRGGTIRQISIDHTWVQEALERGLIQPEEASGHPNAHVIRRYLGSPTPPEVDFRMVMDPAEGNPLDDETSAGQGVKILPGDFLLLCSDGLTDLVKNEEILAAFQQYSMENAGHQLIDLANQRGGHDNITLIAIQVPDPAVKAAPVPAPLLPMRIRALFSSCLGVILLAVIVGAVAGGYLLYSRAQSTPTPTPTITSTPTLTRTPFPTRSASMTPSPLVTLPSTTPMPLLPPGGIATVTAWPTNTPGLPIVSKTP